MMGWHSLKEEADMIQIIIHWYVRLLYSMSSDHVHSGYLQWDHMSYRNSSHSIHDGIVFSRNNDSILNLKNNENN